MACKGLQLEDLLDPEGPAFGGSNYRPSKLTPCVRQTSTAGTPRSS